MQTIVSRHKCFAALLAAAGLAFAAAPGAAQQTFTEATEVVVVEVPVQVVKDGEPVRGLTAKDFEVFDGRKKVAITGFEALDLDAAAAPAAPGVAAAQVPVSARRHFLMLFDLTFSEPKSLFNARRAAQDVVKTLHPADLVAVATYNTLQGPQLILGFTPDRRQVSAALETLGLPKFVDRAQDPLRFVLSDAVRSAAQRPPTDSVGTGAGVREATEAEMVDTLKSFAIVSDRAEKTVQHEMVRNLTVAFSQLARLMAEVEGRKYVVYLSEGFDSTLATGSGSTGGGNDLSNLVGEATSDDRTSGDPVLSPSGGTGSDSQFGDTRTLNALEKMLEEFRRADCAIQSVNIAGLRADAEQGLQRADGRESLLNMAKSTGGDFYENYNNLSTAMGQMLRRTGVTYVLSFQPEDVKLDGSYRKLRVELKNAPRGARVVARPGWYAPRPYKQQPVMARLLETANQMLGPESGSVSASVLAAPFAAAGGMANVPVVVEVDGPSLLAGKQEAQLPLEIYIYALNQDGAVADFVTQTVGLDLTKAESTLRQAGLKYFANFQLPPGTYSIRTLVRNGVTGNSGLRVTELVVPAFGKGEPELLPAIFQDASPGRWVNLRQAKKTGEQDPPYLFMVKNQPYVPTSRPVLGTGQDVAVVLQGYNLGAGDWKAAAQVLAADGKEVPGGALQVTEKEPGAGGGPTRMLGTFRAPALQPGDYTLRVTLTDGAGKSETSNSEFAVAGARGARG